MTAGEELELHYTRIDKLLGLVRSERLRQDSKWGGPQRDDHYHSIFSWVRLIKNYAGWAEVMGGMESYEKAKSRLIQVAALALAAAEHIDRNHKEL